jgi:hypothetical protein
MDNIVGNPFDSMVEYKMVEYKKAKKVRMKSRNSIDAKGYDLISQYMNHALRKLLTDGFKG